MSSQSTKLMVAFAVSYLSLSVVLVQASEPLRAVRRERIPGIERVPTCEDVGLCRNEQRVVAPKSDVRTVARLKQRGCSVKHDLQDDVAFACPKGVATRGARAERAFRAQDIPSTKQIKADRAWAAGITGSGVKIAILDTGVETTHADISGTVFAVRNFTTGQPDDALGHGTHVSGIITGNGIRDISGNRVVGVSGDASLLVGKVCNDAGWCLEGDILAGMEWAASEGAKVVNLSLGGGSFGSHCDDDSLARKANWLVDQGITVVAAAGNNSSGVGTPACGSKVIAVGAVDANDVRPSWSSYGAALDVMAPGVDILSSYSCLAAGSCPGTWYAWMSGTSMASPHVAGVAALLLEKFDQLTPAQVRDIITASAHDIGTAGYDIYHGFGRVDADAALKKAEELFPPDPACPDADGDGVTVCDNDCDDNDASVYPGAPELCDGKDNDCNGLQDDECRFEGFCGDRICQSGESHLTCPRDCRNTVPERGNRKKIEDIVCGDGICQPPENSRTCSRDCHTVPDSSGGTTGGSGVSSPGKSNAGSNGNAGGGTRGNSGAAKSGRNE